MVIKKPRHRRPAIGRGLARKKPPTYMGTILSPAYPSTPIELAGKWIAWSRDRRIVASGDTLAGVVATVASLQVQEASYERVPRFDRPRVR